jgi:hypothetical protein
MVVKTCIKSTQENAFRSLSHVYFEATGSLTVLQHIPDNPKLVEISSTALTSESLFQLDHDSLDIVLVQESVWRERMRLGEDKVRKLFDLRG